MGNPDLGNGGMTRLRDRRFFAVGVSACLFGGLVAGAMVGMGFPSLAAGIAGACTAGIAVLIAAIASQFYNRWFPELTLFAELERREALHNATPYRRLIAWVVVLEASTWFASPILEWLQSHGGNWALVLGLVATWATPLLIAVWAVRGAIRHGLRRQLAAKGLTICVQCGYDVRGLTEPRCPECGHPSSAVARQTNS